MEDVIDKVESLESNLNRFIAYTDRAIREQREEMWVFREEMRLFREQMQADRDKSDRDRQAEREETERKFKIELEKIDNESLKRREELERKIQADKEEVERKFKIELEKHERDIQIANDKWQKDIDEAREERKAFRRELGEISKKMGTITEDIIAPGIRPVIRKYFHCEPDILTQRYLRRKEGDSYEVDILAVCEDMVFTVEVKSTLRPVYIDEMVEKLKLFKDFFPEYKDKKFVPLIGGLMCPDNILKYATKKGIYVIAYREWEYVDILNFDEVGTAS